MLSQFSALGDSSPKHVAGMIGPVSYSEGVSRSNRRPAPRCHRAPTVPPPKTGPHPIIRTARVGSPNRTPAPATCAACEYHIPRRPPQIRVRTRTAASTRGFRAKPDSSRHVTSRRPVGPIPLALVGGRQNTVGSLSTIIPTIPPRARFLWNHPDRSLCVARGSFPRFHWKGLESSRMEDALKQAVKLCRDILIFPPDCSSI